MQILKNLYTFLPFIPIKLIMRILKYLYRKKNNAYLKCIICIPNKLMIDGVSKFP